MPQLILKPKKPIKYSTRKASRCLKSHREFNAWTQEDASKFWCVDRSVYTKYETTSVPLEFCLYMSEILNIDLYDIVTKEYD